MRTKWLRWACGVILLLTATTASAQQMVLATADGLSSSSNPDKGYTGLSYTLDAATWIREYQFSLPAIPAGQQLAMVGNTISQYTDDQEPLGYIDTLTLYASPLLPGATYNQVFSSSLITLGTVACYGNSNSSITYVDTTGSNAIYNGLEDIYNGTAKIFVLPNDTGNGFIQTQIEGYGSGMVESVTEVFQPTGIPEPSTFVGVAFGLVAALGLVFRRRSPA